MTYKVGLPALSPEAQVAWIEKRVSELEAERDRLREVLAAYRSALRSGEAETPHLQSLGDAALAAQEPK